MDFGLSEEQAALQDSVRRFLDENVNVERLRAHADNPDSTDIWAGLVELGVPALLVPENQNGVGLNCLDAALVAECLGYAAAPAPFIGTAVVAPLALQHAPAALRDDLLGGSIDGRLTVGLGFSELAGARGRAGVQADNERLTGTALFVLDPLAPWQLVATTAGEIYCVDSTAEGLSARTLTTIDRTRASGELTFLNTPATRVTNDAAVTASLLNIARVMLVADTLGASQKMLDAAVSYAGERRQFGRLIGSFQAVKHLCAEMAAALEPCRAMMWYAAHAQTEVPAEAALVACHAKAHMSEVGTFVARTATEVHGGIGFTDLLGLHYWFKRIGFNRQALGAPELVRSAAAELQGL